MLDLKALSEYVSSHLNSQVDFSQEEGIQQSLNLFQAFKRVYDQNPALLTELLSLEKPGELGALRSGHLGYVLGMVMNHEPVVVTNLIGGRSQTFACSQGGLPIWTLGRDPAQAALAVRDRRLSRCHGALVYDAVQGFMLYDFGSTNGTFVNGIRLRHGYNLQDGDHIRLGSLNFRFFNAVELQRLPPPPPPIIQWIEGAISAPTLPVTEPGTEQSEAEVEASSTSRQGEAEREPGHRDLEETVWFLQRQAIETTAAKRPTPPRPKLPSPPVTDRGAEEESGPRKNTP